MTSCDPAVNGFVVSSEKDSILNQQGEQMTETTVNPSTGAMVSAHVNVWVGAAPLATYAMASQDAPLTSYFDDPLGTRRVETDYAGNTLEQCPSLPYGDGESCQPTPTEHLFTGKERDAESGNDYFGARYYASSMGRWLSPDPSQLWYADPSNPQSMNLYGYAWNKPNKYVDSNGDFINLPLAGIGAGVGFATGFLGSAISQEISNGKVNWGTAAAYGVGGTATGALAGFTFGGSLLVTAAADIGMATVGTAAGGIISRSLTDLHSDPSLREDALSGSVIGTDLATGFAGGVIGETVGMGYKIIDATAAPKAPFGNVANNIRRLERIAAWKAAQEQIANRASAYNAVTGALAGNAGIPSWSAWSNSNNNVPNWDEFDWLNLQNNSGCAQTGAYDSFGNSTGMSGCQ